MKRVIVMFFLCLTLTMFLGNTANAQPSEEGPGFSTPPVKKGAKSVLATFAKDPEVKKIREQLAQRRADMSAFFAQPQVDAGRVKSLQQEINQLHNQLADRGLDLALEFKKENPSWQPNFGARKRTKGPKKDMEPPAGAPTKSQ